MTLFFKSCFLLFLVCYKMEEQERGQCQRGFILLSRSLSLPLLLQSRLGMSSETGVSCSLAYGVVIRDIHRLAKSLLFSLS